MPVISVLDLTFINVPSMLKPVAKSAVFVPLITTFAPESVAFEVTLVNVPASVELDFTLNTAESTSTFEVAVKVIRSSEVISNSPSAGELISNVEFKYYSK